MGEHGVKETKEAILALVIIGKFVADKAKDGLDFSDAMALGQKLMDEAFKAKVMAGVQGMELIPAEMKDLKLAEVFELAQVIPDIIAEIQKA
jgi:urease gamma subunit